MTPPRIDGGTPRIQVGDEPDEFSKVIFTQFRPRVDAEPQPRIARPSRKFQPVDHESHTTCRRSSAYFDEIRRQSPNPRRHRMNLLSFDRRPSQLPRSQRHELHLRRDADKAERAISLTHLQTPHAKAQMSSPDERQPLKHRLCSFLRDHDP